MAGRLSRRAAIFVAAIVVIAIVVILRSPQWNDARTSQAPRASHHDGDSILVPQAPTVGSFEHTGDDRFRSAFERGIAAYNADDTEAALDAFEEAVRLAPDNPEARINLGLVYMRLQRPEDGLRELAAGAHLQRERSDNAAAHSPAPGNHANTIRE